MKKTFLTAVCALFCTAAFSWPALQSGPVSFENHNYNALRVGVGFEKSPYMELGYTILNISEKDLSSGSFAFYFGGQITRNVTGGPNDYLYGGKFGFETSWLILMWGLELKYLTNEDQSQMFFTPKVGVSLLGGASLLYGYNTPTKNNKLSEVGQHQISLTVQLSKKLLRDFKSSGTETTKQ